MPTHQPSSTPPAPVLRAFRAALRAFPPAHRRRFATEMEQVFRAQWAHANHRSRPSAALFLIRTAIDLLGSASHEHFDNLRTLMNPRKPLPPVPRFLCSLGAAVLITALGAMIALGIALALPKAYLGECRILLRNTEVPPPSAAAIIATTGVDPFRMQTELEILGSMELARRVADDLKQGPHSHLLPPGTTPEQAAALAADLQRRTSFRRYRNTPVVAIRVQDPSPVLASAIANSLAEQYLALQAERLHATPASRPAIMQTAQPFHRPVSPNLPLLVAVGLLAGTVLGLIAMVAVWLHLSRSTP